MEFVREIAKRGEFQVGDAKTTLRGATSLTSVQIDGIDKNPRLITGTSKADTNKKMLDGAGNDSLSSGDGTDILTTTFCKLLHFLCYL